MRADLTVCEEDLKKREQALELKSRRLKAVEKDLKRCKEDLDKREQALELKSRSLKEANAALQETNTTLKVLLKHREDDRVTLEEQLAANVHKLVMPYIESLKRLNLSENQADQVNIIEEHLKQIVSPFLRNLTSKYFDLTPRESQIATLLKEGKTSKEMADILNISAKAVDFHRRNLRAKLGITNKKMNIIVFLSAFS
jgi:DNA-binding CsgD family transcriptional regulator